MFEAIFWRWLLFWGMFIDGFLGIITLGALPPQFSPKAAEKYRKVMQAAGKEDA